MTTPHTSAVKYKHSTPPQSPPQGALIIGTGLAFASLIVLPAVAARFGISAALTGALRIALMRASSQVVSGTRANGETVPAGLGCH